MQRISSEFVGFVRETGVRAFDRLSTRSKEVNVPLRPVLRAWSKLSEDDKSDLFDELISTVQTSDASAPPPPRPSGQQDIRRFDPAEVEATLPAKKSRKKAAASKKKKR
jgi:hypothetical protein